MESIDKEIITYTEMLQREKVSLQRGMNFRINPNYSVLLMSVRKGAPYHDRWHEDSGLLEYEGHDQTKCDGVDPKSVDQPLVTPTGRQTQNGKFMEAAATFRRGEAPAEVVRVYEKIRDGVWCDCGMFELVNGAQVKSGGRMVCRFFLRPSTLTSSRESVLGVSRRIPTEVKVEVWRRDHGKCVLCGSAENLHFDHELPYSKGGTSLSASNVRLLCMKHNLVKGDRIE
jgi:hypothetical protein